MKKILILLVFICIFICGCTPIQKMNYEDIIALGTEKNVSVFNKYRRGYKYNLPKGLSNVNSTEFNEVLASKNYMYYLYIDGVSYYNKVIEKYEVSEKPLVSMPISYEDKYGYLEINELSEGKYFIEIMYNYAKIEVVVRYEDINEAIANAISVITSIKFNDNVLKTFLDEEISQFGEYEVNIFETTSSSTVDDFLHVLEQDVYEENNDVYDSDLIK